MREPSTIKGMISVTWKDFSQMIRLEASNRFGVCECVTCGKRAHWQSGQMHAGHFLAARYAKSLVKFEESNVHVQCRNCNCDGRVAWLRPHASKKQESVTTRYFTWMIKHYGLAEIERLERLRNESREMSDEEFRLELRAIRADCKRRIETAKRERGL